MDSLNLNVENKKPSKPKPQENTYASSPQNSRRVRFHENTGHEPHGFAPRNSGDHDVVVRRNRVPPVKRGDAKWDDIKHLLPSTGVSQGDTTVIPTCRFTDCPRTASAETVGYCYLHFLQLYNELHLDIPTADDVQKFIREQESKNRHKHELQTSSSSDRQKITGKANATTTEVIRDFPHHKAVSGQQRISDVSSTSNFSRGMETRTRTFEQPPANSASSDVFTYPHEIHRAPVSSGSEEEEQDTRTRQKHVRRKLISPVSNARQISNSFQNKQYIGSVPPDGVVRQRQVQDLPPLSSRELFQRPKKKKVPTATLR